jgi:hypothetical protein
LGVFENEFRAAKIAQKKYASGLAKTGGGGTSRSNLWEANPLFWKGHAVSDAGRWPVPGCEIHLLPRFEH